jgi:hypothetical protein
MKGSAALRALVGRLSFLTYPSSDAFYGAADVVIRNVAVETGTPLIDVAAHFRALCPRGDCPALLFKDQHPTAEGTAIAAKTIADWFANHPRETGPKR